jgi:hypothetical protein
MRPAKRNCTAATAAARALQHEAHDDDGCKGCGQKALQSWTKRSNQVTAILSWNGIRVYKPQFGLSHDIK